MWTKNVSVTIYLIDQGSIGKKNFKIDWLQQSICRYALISNKVWYKLTQLLFKIKTESRLKVKYDIGR